MMYQKDYSEVIKALETNVDGLSQKQAKERLEQNGYNELKEGRSTPIWKMLLETLKDPLVIILLIAAAIQIFLGEGIEAGIIILVVVINAILGVSQTKKAENSINSLKQLSSPNAKVWRDHQKQVIPAREVVIGDVVEVEAGDYVPADGRLIETQTLKVEEGMLTGEAEAVLKSEQTISEEVSIGDQRNMLFSSTTVVYGRGKMVVTQTAMQTEVGKVASLLETAGSSKTPLQQKLDDFGKKLGFFIMALAVVIFVVQVFRGYSNGIDSSSYIIEAFMFAIAVAVAAIPEALTSIVTIVLAAGTKKMAKHKAIIRKLPAVETLGATSVICTDKTGTLTQNKMQVVDFYMYGEKVAADHIHVPPFSHEEELIASAVLCNDAEVSEKGNTIGDPTEVALLQFADSRQLDYKVLREKYDRLSEIPFDSDRKLMSTVNNIQNDAIMFTKGAPDVVFSRCQYVLKDGEQVPFTEEIKEIFLKKNESYSNRALRVLAFAIKDVPDDNFIPCLEDEQDMVLIGLMAMMDPPREEVFEAAKRAKEAGIKTVMITGDHQTTAVAIAKDIGIMTDEHKALTGKQLDALSDDELDKNLEDIRVYARVSPENKIRIVKAWQKKGHIAAMTGDGVNDAPALKQADVGIGMGSGTDVAKEAAAMILTDDNYATIVSAVEVGRSVYANIKKTITYLLAGNLAAIIAILFAVTMNWANPFTALQLLFINLINDSLPAIALGMEPVEKGVMNQKPRHKSEGIFAGGTWQTVMIRGIIMSLAVIIAQYWGNQTSVMMGTAMAFSTITLARLCQTFPARSNEHYICEIGFFKNRYVLGAVGICLLGYCIVLLPGIREIFAIPSLFGIVEVLKCAALALIASLCMEAIKWKKIATIENKA